ncbi:4Fe-4S binding protein [Metallumcola ferriviriculae]|uniref:4Fe-4S binding protein n=1 Tax=Metallumcola ferriviriculae TaxID=3039180 RepID=A0AAU0URH5_9FIRM|nr:4Fe-4S binding protein [Desulfitibacteraceae bacterium MK1]
MVQTKNGARVGRVSIGLLKEAAKIQGWLPGAKSMVIYAERVLEGPINTGEIRHAVSEFKSVDERLSAAARDMALALETRGAKSLPIPPYFPLEMSHATKGLVGDVSLKEAAAQAGMGIIGKNGLLITPKWGPRLRLAGVVTEAPLEALPTDPLPSLDRVKSRCDGCNRCMSSCPAGAITEGGVDVGLCSKQVGEPFGLRALIKHGMELTQALQSKPEAIPALMSSEKIWNFYQNYMVGMYFSCVECMRVCPSEGELTCR